LQGRDDVHVLLIPQKLEDFLLAALEDLAEVRVEIRGLVGVGKCLVDLGVGLGHDRASL
jgi:hypothetical protein